MPSVVIGDVRGPQGPAGPAGRSLLSGSGSPSSSLGIEGDVYLDSTNFDLYEKGASSWNLIGNMKGGQGETGPVGPEGPRGPQGASGTIARLGASGQASGQASGTNPSVSVSVTEGGTSQSREYDLAFSFGIPKGADGVVTDAMGAVGFQVNSDGQLIAYTAGSASPNLSIDQNGQLIYTY